MMIRAISHSALSAISPYSMALTFCHALAYDPYFYVTSRNSLHDCHNHALALCLYNQVYLAAPVVRSSES